jgi:hypothetical protein
MPERAADPARPRARRERTLVRVCGCVIVGGALAVALGGALAGMPVVPGLGLVVAVEETLEFLVVAGALRIDRVPRVRAPAMRLRVGSVR